MRRWIIPTEALLVYLVLLGFSMCVYTGFRLLFYHNYHPLFSGVGGADILRSFVRGLRFDLSTLAATMGPPFLLLQFLSGSAIHGKIRTLLLFVTLPFFWLSMFLFFVDLHYYAESGRRLSYEIFALSHDVGAALGIILPYTGSLLIWPLSCIVFSWVWMRIGRTGNVIRRYQEYPSRMIAVSHHGLFLCVFVAFSIFAGRGGFSSQAPPAQLCLCE